MIRLLAVGLLLSAFLPNWCVERTAKLSQIRVSIAPHWKVIDYLLKNKATGHIEANASLISYLTNQAEGWRISLQQLVDLINEDRVSCHIVIHADDCVYQDWLDKRTLLEAILVDHPRALKELEEAGMYRPRRRKK